MAAAAPLSVAQRQPIDGKADREFRWLSRGDRECQEPEPLHLRLLDRADLPRYNHRTIKDFVKKIIRYALPDGMDCRSGRHGCLSFFETRRCFRLTPFPKMPLSAFLKFHFIIRGLKHHDALRIVERCRDRFSINRRYGYLHFETRGGCSTGADRRCCSLQRAVSPSSLPYWIAVPGDLIACLSGVSAEPLLQSHVPELWRTSSSPAP